MWGCGVLVRVCLPKQGTEGSVLFIPASDRIAIDALYYDLI